MKSDKQNMSGCVILWMDRKQEKGLDRRVSCKGLKYIQVELCNIQLVKTLSSTKISVLETEIYELPEYYG